MAFLGDTSTQSNINVVPGRRTARKVRQTFFRREADTTETLVSSLNTMKLTNPSPVLDFSQMNLKPDLFKGIMSCGLEKPAGCQQNVILPMIQGRDVICQAQSGMGKTAAFCISILQRLDLNDPNFKVLVLAPTRELAQQILTEFEAFSWFMNVNYISCIGGIKMSKLDKTTISSGNFHVAVGTLGRISNLLSRRIGIDGNLIKMFVMDEADKMITDSSFTKDLRNVFQRISSSAQIICTSATMPSVAFDRCCEVMRKPFKFLLQNDQLTLDGMRQFYIKVTNDADKLLTIDDLFPIFNEASGIIFCRTRSRTEKLTAQMKAKGYRLTDITANLEQSERTSRFRDFKNGLTRVLIASDLLGRGVDIHHVQVVVNYDIPKVKLEYIHRIGRAGRYGKNGVAITLVTETEFEKINELEKYYSTEIHEFDSKQKEDGGDWAALRNHLYLESKQDF